MKYFALLLLLTIFSCQKKGSNSINLEQGNCSFEVDDTVYSVEKDLKTISAFADKQLIWKQKIIPDSLKAWEKFIGKPKIRFVEFKGQFNTLFVVYGKHSYFKLKTKNGEIVDEGSE